ncbi:MAG: bifunctional 4-hydroxy-2-oxoglutarate aldolase/2-dehydro-3-deoxy-phosphogluconate aldolase [Terracidiphilus sp.]|nr:bifunctional 4-hydroxy-2-oxoglutarate aldolase/2-dehydro-3-deoxy-phosphogluconate aldolase [Terracidiphilus sp.]
MSTNSLAQSRSALSEDRSVLSAIYSVGILPAIRVDTVDDALKAVDALRRAAVSVCEVAMSSTRSTAILRAVLHHVDDQMIVGAGTVLSPETAACCVHEGARFIVTPTLNSLTIAHCRRHGIPIIAGAFTPTEILSAWEAGASCVKVFPVGCAGGPSFIRAIKAPMPHIDLLPMGGVSVATAGAYIRAGASALGVGSDLISAAGITKQDVSEIVERVNAYREQIDEVRGAVQ